MNIPEPPFQYQLQHALAELGQADNQCTECGVYRVDGQPPLLHRNTCESSGTAAYYRRMSRPSEMPSWVEQGYTTDYGPGYQLEGDDS